MPKHRLFCPGLVEGLNVLNEAESHHGIATLRLQQGHQAELFDGLGRVGIGTVVAASKKSLRLDVVDALISTAPPTLLLTLAVAMPRSHRQGYLIEKCTELGVSAIWPMSTDRAVAKPGDGSIDKWKRRAIEACKQSGNNWLPSIEPVLTFGEVLAKSTSFDLMLLADACTNQSIGDRLASLVNCTSLLVMIGPEGGWSDSEREQAVSAGVGGVALAAYTLRTETAAIAACCAVSLRNTAPHD